MRNGNLELSDDYVTESSVFLAKCQLCFVLTLPRQCRDNFEPMHQYRNLQNDSDFALINIILSVSVISVNLHRLSSISHAPPKTILP